MKLYKFRFLLQNFLVFTSFVIFWSACGDPEVNPDTGESIDFETVPQQFPLQPGIIDEASGLANSFSMDGFLWTLQDSGRPNSLYLISKDGKSIREFNIPGSSNHDWEDLASGPGPIDGVKYLYIGEIGNNNPPMTSTNIIYRVPEVSAINESFSQSGLEKITFSYPDGPRDAESLMLDPLTKDIFVISKESSETGIYRLPYPQSTSEIITAEKVGTIPSVSIATSGDISIDGKEILIRTYINVFYWKRKDGESVGQTLTQRATKILSVELEPQGEAICFKRDLSGFFTLSEIGMSTGVTLNLYKRK